MAKQLCGICRTTPSQVLVNGVCPKCGADYATTANFFSLPIKKKVTKGGTTIVTIPKRSDMEVWGVKGDDPD